MNQHHFWEVHYFPGVSLSKRANCVFSKVGSTVPRLFLSWLWTWLVNILVYFKMWMQTSSIENYLCDSLLLAYQPSTGCSNTCCTDPCHTWRTVTGRFLFFVLFFIFLVCSTLSSISDHHSAVMDHMTGVSSAQNCVCFTACLKAHLLKSAYWVSSAGLHIVLVWIFILCTKQK